MADGPVYVNGYVDGGVGGTVYALNAATGQIRWTHPTADAILSSPAVAGGAIYVGSDIELYALNAGL